jgi:hypothetical protein
LDCQPPSNYIPPAVPEVIKNYCTPGKCSKCVRIGSHYSCSMCLNSRIVIADTIDGNSYYRCEGSDSGVANCAILYSRFEIATQTPEYTNYTGCYRCNPGFQSRPNNVTKVFECEPISISNCAISQWSLWGSPIFSCIRCDAGYYLNYTDCLPLPVQQAIPNCRHHFIWGDEDMICQTCDLGYGVSNDQKSCLSDAPTKGCLSHEMRENPG